MVQQTPNGKFELLQFRKCDDKSWCVIKNDPLPPFIPVPVIAPDGEHYLVFDDLYRKTQATEKDCPSLSVQVSQKKKDHSSFIAVVWLQF